MKLTEKKLRTTIRKMIRENLLIEKANAAAVDPARFPLKLSDSGKFKGDKADQLATGGADDGDASDDIVDTKPGGKSVKSLKPSQSSMDIGKAVAFALAAIVKKKPFPEGPGGDLGAIITNDGHIMDGHHRWIATGMIDPTAEVGGEIVDFPAKEMIAALNMITVHLTGREAGKSGSGGFEQFNEEGIKKQLETYVKEGVWSVGSGEDVVAACETFSGVTGEEAVAVAAKKMADNVSELTLSVPDGFPERSDMPVISQGEGHLDQAIELLQQGKVDLNKPYLDNPEEEASEEINDGVKKSNNVILERWTKLAGLIK
jgi:hypothetical protein